MKVIFSLLFIMAGICGACVFFLSSVVVNSTISFINGVDLSLWLGAFSILVLINGIVLLFSSD